MIEKRKRGRPRKLDGKRGNLTMRITNEMRAELRARADRSGRSMSEEVELILEKVLFPILAPSDEENAA